MFACAFAGNCARLQCAFPSYWSRGGRASGRTLRAVWGRHIWRSALGNAILAATDQAGREVARPNYHYGLHRPLSPRPPLRWCETCSWPPPRSPLQITKRGKEAYVPMSEEQFRRLEGLEDALWAARALEALKSGFVGTESTAALLQELIVSKSA